ncbi:MAG: hypothetical protein RSB96_00665 [Oscillospiraceae bacterium]
MIDFLFLGIVCFLIAVGIAAIISHVVDYWSKPKKEHLMFATIPLQGYIEDVEQQLYWAYAQIMWSNNKFSSIIVLDVGIDPATLVICKSFCKDKNGVIILKPDEMMDYLTNKNLQI